MLRDICGWLVDGVQTYTPTFLYVLLLVSLTSHQYEEKLFNQTVPPYLFFSPKKIMHHPIKFNCL